MNDINHINLKHGNAVREAVFKFLVPLQTTRVIDRAAFEELFQAVKSLATELKRHDLLPKALLNEVHTTSKVLRNEAPYFRGETTELEGMANKLELVFNLILLGEGMEDRVPGVPRII